MTPRNRSSDRSGDSVATARTGQSQAVRSIPGIATVAGIYLVLSMLSWNQIEEDAFIYLRNAANLAEGYGYVFNRGAVPIETGSSFLWLQLLTLLHWLNAPMVPAAKLLGMAFGLIGLLLTWELGSKLIGKPYEALVPPLLLGVSVPFVMWGQRGLETPLYTALLLWTSLWVCDARRRRLAWLPAAFLLLGRPEAPPIAFALLLFLVPRHGERSGSILPLVLLFAIATALETARFVYFHDLVSQPFYLKMIKGNFEPWQILFHYLRESGLLLLMLPVLAVAWRRSFWTRERSLLALVTVLLLGWAARTGDTMPYSRHFAPALPFFFVLLVVAVDALSASLGPYRRAASAAAYALIWCLVALNPNVPTGRSQAAANPLHDLIVAYAREPSVYFPALMAEVRDPNTRSVLDRTDMPIEQNWQALVGKYVAANYEPDAVVVYDQMGQTPYYAGLDTTFIDSFGLTDRSSGFFRFDLRAETSAVLRAYDVVASALVGWAFPEEERHPSMEQVLDAIFGAEPDLVLVNRYAAVRAGRTPTRAMLQDSRLRRDFEHRYLLGGMVDVYERRERARSAPVAPEGLMVRPIGRAVGRAVRPDRG